MSETSCANCGHVRTDGERFQEMDRALWCPACIRTAGGPFLSGRRKLTEGELRAYRRGYNTRAHGNWPEVAGPYPPEPVVREIMLAAQNLRDVVDTQCATFEKDDPFVTTFDAPIARVDEALVAVKTWLRGGVTAPLKPKSFPSVCQLVVQPWGTSGMWSIVEPAEPKPGQEGLPERLVAAGLSEREAWEFALAHKAIRALHRVQALADETEGAAVFAMVARQVLNKLPGGFR